MSIASRYRGPGNAAVAAVLSDPGRIRLHKAMVAAGAVMLAIGAMAGIGAAMRDGDLAITISGFVALQSVLMVKDATSRARTITTAYLFLPACGATTLAAALHQWPRVEQVGLVAVVGLAVWVRQFGLRAAACGALGFFGYFFAMLIKPDHAALVVELLAICTGVASALVMRAAVLPERPRPLLRRLVDAFRKSELDVVTFATAHVGTPSGVDEDSLVRGLDRMTDIAMLIEDRRVELDPIADHHALSSVLYDSQVLIEQVAANVWTLDQADRTDEIDDATRELRRTLSDNNSHDSALKRVTRTGWIATLIDRATESNLALLNLAYPHDSEQSPTIGGPSSVPVSGPDPSQPSVETLPAEHRWRPWQSTVRAPVQAMVAASTAVVVGEVISADRWYWAVLTAFMVFLGTSTVRGEVLTRAWRRSLGTALGVIAALAIVFAIGHHLPVQFAVIIACAFMAVFIGPTSYTLVTFFITVLLASLYELLGVFDLQIMEWRLEETIAGAVMGIVATYFVFSTSTTSILVDGLATYLDRLSTVVEASVGAIVDPERPVPQVWMVRALDAAQHDALAAGESTRAALTRPHRRTERQIMRMLPIISRHTHSLTVSAVIVPQQAADCSLVEKQMLSSKAEDIHRTAALVLDIIAHGRAGSDRAVLDCSPEDKKCSEYDSMPSTTTPSGALQILATLDRCILDMTR